MKKIILKLSNHDSKPLETKYAKFAHLYTCKGVYIKMAPSAIHMSNKIHISEALNGKYK